MLAGVVVDERTGAALQGAKIALRSLSLEAVSDATGQFTIQGVPTGFFEVRFEAPGYVSVVEEVELAEADFLQVRLSPLGAVLDELLVRTGRRNAPDGPPGLPIRNDAAPWRSVLDLLEDQVPGVVVRRRGALGAGAAIFIRGVGTFQANSAPDVYLDGVRIDSTVNPDALHTLDQIHADQVARVRVYKGAASGAHLGGANGAIVIETNRGPTAADSRR